MKRLTTVDELSSFRTRVLADNESSAKNPCLVICAGTCGQASGANDVLRIMKRYIIDEDLRDIVDLRVTGCQGFCETNPFILVEPEGNLYPKLKMEDVPRVIDAAVKGEVAEELLYRNPENNEKCRTIKDIPFFSGQKRLLSGQNQKLDPIRITDYFDQGGYAAFEKIISNPNPEWIIREIKDSGIRGRGGAGFPVGIKWENAHKSGKPGQQKIIVCNADEGDPGAYMDRSILEGNPHAIIEGLFAAGVAIGADTGIVYVRSEYPLAIKHIHIAIRQARDMGLLGQNILGTGINFDITIVRGAGAFVCGEETALIKSIEGLMGHPRQRPPYPITKGINGNPTCINNVETLANVPIIIRMGAKEYAKIGMKNNTGTKIFSMVGKIRNTGLVEVPLGTKIKDVVYEIGGGAPGKARVKAIQTGGPSGGCIPAELFDLEIGYESLAKAGSIMGSGGMIVMDENTCMVDVAKYFMNFLKEESCGKCFTCRDGTQRMYEILDDITKGKGTLEQLSLLEELAPIVKDTTLCGLGNTAANPVLSTLRYFRHEYIEHIEKKHCRAGVCKELVGAPCHNACPVDTEAWKYVAHIQRGEYEDAYMVIRNANPFPSVCARVCSHPCEDRCRLGTSGDKPVAIRTLKRFVCDNVDPSIYEPERIKKITDKSPKVAVVGAGPTGLTAAHYLSLAGCKVTVFEAEEKPGGMLVCGIPEYRLPRKVLEREIKGLIGENVALKTNTALGKDFTVDSLLDEGFKAVLLSIGAHKSRPLGIEDEETEGVYPGIEFLKAYNMRGQELAKGRVGIIGGGNSAVDAARVAIRQKDVTEVTILYRRTRKEMPAYEEEIKAALEEGVRIIELETPVKIVSQKNKLVGVDFIKNELGKRDSSGRRRPVPVNGTEHTIKLDTLIVGIGETPDTACIEGVACGKNTVVYDADTLETSRKGVFAGGDVATGPNTVIEAVAAGKKAAKLMKLFIDGKAPRLPAEVHLPDQYIEKQGDEEPGEQVKRVEPPHLPIEKRVRSFKEVDLAISEEQARREAERCLRCDLEFTQVEREALVQGET